LSELERPAQRAWIAQRVVQLFGHYPATQLHEEVVSKVAKDWISELADLPEWAIDEACAWWISRHNTKKKRTFRPLPGDISERANQSMSICRTARSILKLFDQYGVTPPPFLKR